MNRLRSTTLLAACVGAVLVASACGSNDVEIDDAASPASPASPQQAPVEVDPAAIVGECMQRHGLSVTVGEDRVDFGSLDQSDPAVVAAIEGCHREASEALQSAATPAADPAGRVQASAATDDAFVEAVFGCMERRGYHPEVAEPEPGVEVDGGVIVEYPTGEEQASSFAEDESACLDEADTAADIAEVQAPN